LATEKFPVILESSVQDKTNPSSLAEETLRKKKSIVSYFSI